MTPEQFEKLPLYVRRAMTRLQDDIDHLRRKLDVMAGGAEGSPVVIHSYDDERPLPESSTIRFYLGVIARAKDDYIDAYIDRDALYLRGGPHGGLAVSPVSGNVVRVKVEPFRGR